MRIICTQKNLLKGVNIVGKISTSRGSLPVLSNILIRAEKGVIWFLATDLEIGIRTQITGKIETEGSFTIPARLFSEFVANCDDENITIELESDTIKFSSQKYTSHVNGIDSSEFPLIPQVKGKPLINFNSTQIKTALSQVVFSASRDESRPILTGVMFIFENNEVKIVATDSYRLAEKRIKSDQNFTETSSVIIPYGSIIELLRILTINEEGVEFYLGDNQVMFGVGKTQIISRVIEGKYPDYEKIIPTTFTNSTIINKNELNQALKVTGIFSRESANNIRLKIKQNELNLIAVAPQVGDNQAKLKVQTTGENMDIAFNSRYILDVLNQIDADEIELKTNKPNSKQERLDPGLIRVKNQTDYKYIIMPLQLDD